MTSPLDASFEVAHRVRPVDLVLPGSDLRAPAAPYLAVEAGLADGGPAEVALVSGDTRLAGRYDGRGLSLRVEAGGAGEAGGACEAGGEWSDRRQRSDRRPATDHRSRRRSRPEGPVTGLALTLTSTHLVVHAREGDRWRVRGRVDLAGRIDPHDETWLAAVTAEGSGALQAMRAGRFGQVGLRDLRLVTHADGTPYREDGRTLLTATSAGPGAFRSGHSSVWSLDPDTLELEHRADLFLRRPGRRGRPGVYGDHAGHLLRDGDRWLFAASTWGDFDGPRAGSRVAAVVAESERDLTTGVHVLDARPLDLPTDGLSSVGVWDPHLVREGAGWVAGYVSATRYFRFHPAVAAGPDLDSLTLRAAATDRRATEGTTICRDGDAWRVLASDGRDGRRGQRERYPAFDLDLTETGELDAHYPTNLPWPTLLEHNGGWLLVGFNGRPYGGPLVGYGSHGEVVLQRSR